MNILLWALQIVVAIFCIMGAAWRFLNYEQAAKDVASMKALPFGVWNAIGAFEILCALALIIPGALNIKPNLTGIAAACLAVEFVLISMLHLNFFGFQFRASNPAVWTLMLAVLAAFIAYGRIALKPL